MRIGFAIGLLVLGGVVTGCGGGSDFKPKGEQDQYWDVMVNSATQKVKACDSSDVFGDTPFGPLLKQARNISADEISTFQRSGANDLQRKLPPFYIKRQDPYMIVEISKEEYLERLVKTAVAEYVQAFIEVQRVQAAMSILGTCKWNNAPATMKSEPDKCREHRLLRSFRRALNDNWSDGVKAEQEISEGYGKNISEERLKSIEGIRDYLKWVANSSGRYKMYSKREEELRMAGQAWCK